MKKKVIVFLIFIAGIIALRFSGVGQYITLERIQERSICLQQVVQERYWYSVIMYIFIYILSVTFSLPAASILTVAGGFLFGIVYGALYANIAATIGATIAFLIVRHLIGKTIQKRYSAQLIRFNKEMHHYGTNYLLLVHFIAVIPFFIVNTLAGLTNISTWTFIWTTSAGIMPASLVYAFAGQQLHTIESVKDIFSSNIILAFLLLTIMAIIPTVFRRIRHMKRFQKA